MRKLAPAFIMTSVLALAGGTALANTTASTTASPTVDPNTNNPQGQSYSDKSGTSPGTNATMDDKAKPTLGSTTDDDKNLHRTMKKTTKKKVAMRSDKMMKSEPTVKSDTAVSSPAPASTPTNNTGATEANSSTGISTGK
jgi:hypothetical protein